MSGLLRRGDVLALALPTTAAFLRRHGFRYVKNNPDLETPVGKVLLKFWKCSLIISKRLHFMRKRDHFFQMIPGLYINLVCRIWLRGKKIWLGDISAVEAA